MFLLEQNGKLEGKYFGHGSYFISRFRFCFQRFTVALFKGGLVGNASFLLLQLDG